MVRDYAGEDASVGVNAPEDLFMRAKCAAGELMMRLVADGLVGPEDYRAANFEL